MDSLDKLFVYSDAEDQAKAFNFLRNFIQQSEEVSVLESDNAALREALREIANPIPYMQKRVKKDERLDGGMAQRLASDPEYLKGIARNALVNTAK